MAFIRNPDGRHTDKRDQKLSGRSAKLGDVVRPMGHAGSFTEERDGWYLPSQILDPVNTWLNRDDYFQKYDPIAARFIENFKLMATECPDHIREVGPTRLQSALVG